MGNEYKNKRRTLFEQLKSVNSSKALFSFQLELADELKRCERLQKIQKENDRKNHMHLLRCYGDTLAWQLLHDHTIRQLSKNQRTPPYLIDQDESFNHTIKIARGILKHDLAVLFADLTNCIRIGDLIIVTNPESPVIIECKSGETNHKFELQGRRGRQLSRMEGTAEYLNKGTAKFFGEEKARLCIETGSPSRYNWDIVNSVLNEAESNGQGYIAVSQYEIIGALREEIEFKIPKELTPGQFSFSKPIVANHYRAVEEAWTTVPPPTIWDIDDRFKFALMEGELLVVHIFDPTAFLGYENPNGKITRVDVPLENFLDLGYEIDLEGRKLICSPIFTEKVLYCFQAVESVAGQMIEFGKMTLEKVQDFVDGAIS